MKPQETLYNSRVWLNPESDYASGAVICYAGILDNDSEYLYLELQDCNKKVRLHKTAYESKEDYLKKIKLLKEEIDKYLNFLEHN